MPILLLLLLVFAFVFFVLAGLGIPSPIRFQWIGWGLALWVLTEILSRSGAIGPSLLR
jgi:hypothetical protein